ncbi:MAG: hypothetical protein P8L85_13070, partial [Rubripirellula sp.]|nr:hypothetical protein [Rubripirellula sp.]
ERLQKTNFIHDGLPVGDSRRKLKDCKGQILPFGRPSFNFQQFFGRFLRRRLGSEANPRRSLVLGQLQNGVVQLSGVQRFVWIGKACLRGQ